MADDYMVGFAIASFFSLVAAGLCALGANAWHRTKDDLGSMTVAVVFGVISFTWSLVAVGTILGIGRNT